MRAEPRSARTALAPHRLRSTSFVRSAEIRLALGVDVATTEIDICLLGINQMSRHLRHLPTKMKTSRDMIA